ncbi:helix-turn-helix domain-containing protein [Aquamicrobium sp. LC103]|uniref:helix-turn-helix domain-containing protein n=1 Tax=Aquamicrobium sp. LC103 TaxID=1120658 RepID=UPI0009E4E906|nr:helix-turn-helix domain-containing protein [Aquamicrobium sp. LC103]
MDEILTIQDVAARLKLAERTVYAMVAEREMPAFKVRGQWRIRRSDFERWLDEVALSGQSSAPVRREPRIAAAAAISDIDVEDRSDAVADLPVAALSERRSQKGLHQRFIDALGERVKSHSPITQKPIELDLVPPLPSRVRVYLFNATRPPGGRPLGEHKIQLIMPGQRRGQRGSLDHSDGRIVFLVGYAAEEDVFILWDAGLYSDFAWSRNVQVKAETIVEASAGKLAIQQRHLRPSGAASVTETLIATPATRLVDALQRRVQLTRERMVQD